MEIWAEAGIPARQVLRYATLGNASVLGIDADRGSIEPGKRADMVLVRGDPTQTISDIRSTELVMKAGTLFVMEQSRIGASAAPQLPPYCKSVLNTE
jgi:imidazolonepropionase-like amidohydrolase